MKSDKKISRSTNEQLAILNYMDKNTVSNLQKTFDKIKPGDEFEFIFFGRQSFIVLYNTENRISREKIISNIVFFASDLVNV